MSAAKISVLDHGLLYGDGFLRAFAPIMAACSKLKEHIDRLFLIRPRPSCSKIPMSPVQITRAVVEACGKPKFATVISGWW